ncbi:helix-turn-helix domain-containing protein [bacterium 210820-DFI.6.37]|nr:helix-turn-helix domain-containing protein [bacterium 210820-DFI.6.37]
MSLEKLKIVMKIKGCSADELSDKSGVPKSTINKIICGITPDPRYSTVKQLVNALNLNIDELVDYLDLSADNIDEKFSSAEWDIIKKYRRLDDYGKEAVGAILAVEEKRCNIDPAAKEAEALSKEFAQMKNNTRAPGA